MRRRASVAVVVLSLATGGCFQRHRILVLPPPVPVVAKPLPRPEIEAPPTLESQLPHLDIDEVALEMPPPMDTPPPKPIQRRKPVPAAGGTGTPAPNPPTTPEVETPVTPTPVPAAPQLSEILTDDRRKQYETEFTGYVSRARDVVTQASRRRLSARQQETMQRIKTFLQQAEESKVKDVVTALQLARRADLLGQDLLRSLR